MLIMFLLLDPLGLLMELLLMRQTISNTCGLLFYCYSRLYSLPTRCTSVRTSCSVVPYDTPIPLSLSLAFLLDYYMRQSIASPIPQRC